jgi:hypothetical protein
MKNKKRFHQLASLVLGVYIMSVVSGCNEHHVKSGSGRVSDPIEELGIEGKYEVKFLPLNTSLAGISNAKAKIHIVADHISVVLDMQDSPSMTLHSQFIYTSSVCPSDIHDVNKDGFIDPQEAAKVLGPILIPLDSDLSSQMDGITEFPSSDSLGRYHYVQEGLLSHLIADLQSPDLNPKDELGKLNHGQQLKLEGKVIVIQGVPEDLYVPGSISSIGTNSDRVTLPIACGKISRVLLEESETSESEEDIWMK